MNEWMIPSYSPTTITGVSPPTGPAGTVVVLSGTEFGAGTIVRFGDTYALRVTVESATRIRCSAPPRPAGPCTVSVEAGSGVCTAADAFTYTQ